MFMPSEGDRESIQGGKMASWNSKVVLVARVGKGILGVDVPVMLQEVLFYGKLRLQMELIPTPPFIGKIQISFLEVPKIDFILKPLKSFDLMDLPGLSNWISSTIDTALRENIVDPNIISIPLTNSYTTVRSLGVLKVNLYQMRGSKLAGNDMSHPYVRIFCGGKFKAISKSVDIKNPEWNQTFFILVHSFKDPLIFVVQNSASNIVGSVAFPISEIEDEVGVSRTMWKTIVEHESSKIRGELNFGVQYFAAELTPDPEADLSFDTGIAQISIHQIKDVFKGDKKHVGCFYELYVHKNDVTIDPKNPPKTVPMGTYYRSKNRKRTSNPSWDEIFEIFMSFKDEMNVTFIVRHAIREDVILATWRAPFTQLLNRTDWFPLETPEMAKFYASFLFRPVQVDLSTIEGAIYEPSIGVVKVKVLSGRDLKASKSGYYVAVKKNGKTVGKTRSSLQEVAPVWNKEFIQLVKDRKGEFSLELNIADKKVSVGSVNVQMEDLVNHKNHEIEYNEVVKTRSGDESDGRLRFLIGFYELEEANPKHDEERAFKVIEEPLAKESNCGILDIRWIEVEGVYPTTVRSLNTVQFFLGDAREPIYYTCPMRIGVDGRHRWDRSRAEVIIRDPQEQRLKVLIIDNEGTGAESIVQFAIPLADLKANEWYELDRAEQAKIRINAAFRPIPLILDEENDESGVLIIDLEGANNLIAVDAGGTSDPFCVVRLNGTKFYKTQVIKKSLNPVFNESTRVEIKQKDVSVLQVELRDWNKVTASRTLGQVNVELQNLGNNQWYDLKMPLENVSSGEINFKLKFIPDQDDKSPRRSAPNVIALSKRETTAIKGLEALAENKESVFEPKDLTLSPGKEPDKSSLDRSSKISLSSAAGIKMTIVELIVNEKYVRDLEECKIKVRFDGHSIYKTRVIQDSPYKWNESFTMTPEFIKKKITVIPVWSLDAEEEITIDISQLDFKEEPAEKELILSMREGRLIIKYGLTMDTQNMVDLSKRRRFSLLGM